MKITNRQRDTILAALRHWQDDTVDGGLVNDGLADIATMDRTQEALNTIEIDELCEQINIEHEKPRHLAVVMEGGLVQGIVTDDPDLIGTDAFVIDYDTDGAEEGSTCAIPQGKGKTEDAYVSVQEIGQPAKGVLESAVAFVEADEEAEAE